MPGGMPGGMNPMGQNQPSQAPKRAEDVSKWKPTDYIDAKKENDPRLIEAVHNFTKTKKYVGNKKVALVLIKLLTAEEPQKDAADNTRPGGPGMGGPGMGMESGPRGYGSKSQVPRLNRDAIEAVIVALVTNGTKAAKKALRDVVLGTLKTDDDTVATTGALRALVADLSAENEAVLFRALTDAENLRKPDENTTNRQPGMMPGRYGGEFGGGYGGGGKLSADALRQMTLKLVEPFASEDFRLKLASHILDPDMKSTTINFLSGMLMKPHPDNVEPQLLLFQSDMPDELTKAKLAAFFTEYSGTALGHYLGVYKHKKIRKPIEYGSGAKPGEEPKQSGWGQPAEKTGWGNTSEPGGAPAGMGEGGLMGPMGGYGGMGRGGPGYGNSPAATKSTRELMAGDPQMPARIAEKLWSPEMARFIGARLAQASSLDEAGVVIPLARTMPVDDVRARLHRVMQTHWEGGSRPFLSGVKLPAGGGMGREGMGYGGMGLGDMGLGGAGYGGMESGPAGGQFNKAVCDPGFLVLVKMLPIRPEKNGRGSRGTKHTGRVNQGGRMDEAGMGGPGMMGGRPGMGGNGGLSSITDWQKVHENLLYRFCEAFSSAARNNRDAPAVGMLPIELHSDQNVVARYDIKWPPSAPKNSTLKLDPVEIHYVRIAETGDPFKVWKTYSRALKTQGRMLQQDKVALLDTVKEGTAPGRKLSVDVLITRTQPGTAAPQPTDRKSKKKPVEPLVIEILTIEMKDPAPPAPKAASEKADEKSGKEAEAAKAARLKKLKEKAAAQRLKR